jgi:quercetin dioxygenase-like cupin family protein
MRRVLSGNKKGVTAMSSKVTGAVSAALGSGVAAGMTLSFLDANVFPKSFSVLAGGILGTAATVILFNLAKYILLKIVPNGRQLYDPLSVYEGVWLQDFEKSNKERPYSRVRINYDIDTQQYSSTGQAFAENGDRKGSFTSTLMALDFSKCVLAGAYDSHIDEITENESKDGSGFGRYVFDGNSPRCTSGDGMIFHRGDGKGAIEFKFFRLTNNFITKTLKLELPSDYKNKDPHPSFDSEIIRAYHAWKTEQIAKLSPPSDCGRTGQPWSTTPMIPPKEIIKVGEIEIRILLDGDDTAGKLTMFEFLVPPGARVLVPHYHQEVDEIAYGIEGVLTFTVDGRGAQIGPGDRVFVPRGAVHHFVNAGTERTRTFAVLTPALIGPAYFRDLAALLGGDPPDPARIAEVMRRHGLIPVPPPPASAL